MPSLKPNASLGTRAAVHYTVAVIDSDGREVRRLPRKRNLILDSGLDLVASQRWCDIAQVAVAGTGTSPVKRDSGAVTFARSGTTVTASAGFFESGDVGRLLKWDSGEEAYISTYTDSTHVETVSTGTIAAAQGTVWYVNRTGLQTETKRTAIRGQDSGDNGSTYSLGSWILKRTFIFSAEAGAVTYNEIGWSYTGTPGNNLFGMDIISGGVSLVAGQQLKVIVELTISISPAASTAWANVIIGWSSDGDCCVECAAENIGVSCVGVNGDGYGGGGNTAYTGLADGVGNKFSTLSTDTTALVAQTTSDVGITGDLGSKSLTAQTYVSGSFTRDYIGQFEIADGNSAAIRSLIFNGLSNYVSANKRTYRVLLDTAQTKDSTHRLSLTFRLTWGRTLTN